MKPRLSATMLLIGLMTISLGTWTYQNTCVVFKRKASSYPQTNGGSYSFCGSVDFVEGCINVMEAPRFCAGAPGDPVVVARTYDEVASLGGACTNDACL